MKKIFTIVGILLLTSCTKDEMFLDIEEQIQKTQIDSDTTNLQSPNVNTSSKEFKLYGESYLNQKSGISFWWYAGWGFGNPLDETSGYFSGGQAYDDINEDGFVDILVTHHETESITSTNWYINDGTNKFFEKHPEYITENTNGLSSHKILKTDVNNDGLADFILLGVDETEQGNYGGNFTVLIQQQNKKFKLNRIDEGKGLWYHNGAAGDLNGDGNVDVISADYIWWGDGVGNFINSNISINGLGVHDVLAYEILDINKDGYNDMILGTSPNKNPSTIILNNKGSFNSTNTKIQLPSDRNSGINDIEIYDIDGDGDLDIIELRTHPPVTYTKLYVYLNTNLKFEYYPDYIQNSEDGNFITSNVDKNGWSTFKFDDIDGDGIDDIIPENFHDGYNGNTYNGLKKINGIWKKYTF